ncbi:MAG: TIGR02221 family CRISPR-associated protein [Fidelibacterota bacterium]
MANILISPLGTGSIDKENDRYRPAEYRFSENEKIETSSFVTSVITRHVKKFDKVFLIGTNKSMWDAVYEYYAKEVDDFDQNILKAYSENRELSDNRESLDWDFNPINRVLNAYLKKIEPSAEGGSEVFLIRYGYNDGQLTENLEILMSIAERLKEGDNIYLDITHSFRSIPFFVLALINYIQTLKKVRLKTMYYGMLDVIHELGYAPIVDLKQIVELNQWSDAVSSFIRYGDGYELAEIIKPLDASFSKSLKKMSDALCFNFIGHFKSQIPSLIKGSEQLKNHPIFRYFKPQFDGFVSIFDQDDPVEISLNTAKWLMDHRRYGLSLLCIKEASMQLFYKMYQKDNTEKNTKVISNFIVKSQRIHYKMPDKIWESLLPRIHKINHYRINTAHPNSRRRLSIEEIKTIYADMIPLMRRANAQDSLDIFKNYFPWDSIQKMNKNK